MILDPLAVRIGKLADDVEKIKGNVVNWRIGTIANALITEAKTKAPSDAVLSTVEPFERDESSGNISRLSPPEVVAILRQVAEGIPIPRQPAPVAVPRGRIGPSLFERQF